jgi:hypothetical protein
MTTTTTTTTTKKKKKKRVEEQVSDHPPRTTALESYELDEVDVPLGEAKQMVRALRITIHGQNIYLRALEPIVRIGDTGILYPRIQPDEQTIIGYLTGQPQEGAAITLEYPGQAPVAVPERFTISKLRRPPA